LIIKNFKKFIIFFMVNILILTLCNSASSIENISDSNEEMYHYKNDNGSWIWILSDDIKQSINIKEISAETDEGNLTVTMKINSSVDTSQKSKYVFYCNTTDTGYKFLYTKDFNSAIATPNNGSILDIKHGNVEVDGDTLVGTVELINDTNITELWGEAYLYSIKLTDITNYSQVEYWTDWIPNSYFPYADELVDISDDDPNPTDNSTNTTDNQTKPKSKDKETPAFEFIVLISVMILCLIFKKIHKKERKK